MTLDPGRDPPADSAGVLLGPPTPTVAPGDVDDLVADSGGCDHAASVNVLPCEQGLGTTIVGVEDTTKDSLTIPASEALATLLLPPPPTPVAAAAKCFKIFLHAPKGKPIDLNSTSLIFTSVFMSTSSISKTWRWCSNLRC